MQNEDHDLAENQVATTDPRSSRRALAWLAVTRDPHTTTPRSGIRSQNRRMKVR